LRPRKFVTKRLLDRSQTKRRSVVVDAFVDLPDGSRSALTIFTVDEVGWRKPRLQATQSAG
jgi:hypothetical protein